MFKDRNRYHGIAMVYRKSMRIGIVTGDLLDQKVDAIVNPWNRNVIPWWLLLPRGVSGAIKKRAGYRPFIELRHSGALPLCGASVTSAGRLPFKAIIHVAGIGHAWRSSERSIRDSVRSALKEAKTRKFGSIAVPLIGAGTGGGSEDDVQRIIEQECRHSDYDGEIVIVRYNGKKWPPGRCQCGLWQKNPGVLARQGVPEGFCGFCGVCGAPGHVLHFPGAVPVTIAWCRKHYYRAMILHPGGSIGIFLWGLAVLAAAGLIATFTWLL
ncbi:MAG: macro domain-containing protein [Eubacteriales bacterium]|nr:macro domain-containing protein [Eubacteriales bacterium]